MSDRKYYVKTGNLYFRYWEDNIFPVFVINDQPGALDHAGIYAKSVAQGIANNLGVEIESAEKLYQMPIPYLCTDGGYRGYAKTSRGVIVLDGCRNANEYNTFTWDEIMEYFPSIAEFAFEVEE